MSEKLKLYHNPRCRKSREALNLLTENSVKFDTVLYLKQPPSKETVAWIFDTFSGSSDDLIRKNEAVWKKNFKGKTMSKETLVEAVIEHPILLERPLLITQKNVILGRPLENISIYLQH